MHYLFATWDGGGTVAIDFGIARHLVQRGHTLTILGDPTIEAEAERLGATFVPWREAPHRKSTALEDDLLKDWEPRTPFGLFRRVSERLITGPAAAYARETEAEIRRHRPDVAIVDGAILGPMVATEALAVPTVGICPGFYILPAPGMPPFGLGLRPARGRLGQVRDRFINALVTWAWRSGLPGLNTARATYGLPPLSDPWDQLRGCHSVLVTTAKAYDFAAVLPPNVHYVGPILDDPVWADGQPLALDEDLPLVVVSLSGTYVVGQDDMLRRTVSALDRLPVRGLVCTGPSIDPAEVPSTERVRVVASAPHAQVLPRASVVVTHGGHGTMTKALAAGKPVLCLPKFRDQKDNAVRLAVSGAGLVLSWKARPASIAAAVQRLINEPAFAERAADLGRRIRGEIQQSPLVDLLEAPARSSKAA